MTGFAHHYSRSRKKIWKKGEDSGHLQQVKDTCVDCDGDTLFYCVEQTEETCHTSHLSSFYRTINAETDAYLVFSPEEVYYNQSTKK